MNTIEVMLEASKAAQVLLKELHHGAGSTYDALIAAIALGEAELRREPDETQILIRGERWTHCSKELYQMSHDRSVVRALYTRGELK
jgi:hypothetical protein